LTVRGTIEQKEAVTALGILFVIGIIGRRLRALSAPAAELWFVDHTTRTA